MKGTLPKPVAGRAYKIIIKAGRPHRDEIEVLVNLYHLLFARLCRHVKQHPYSYPGWPLTTLSTLSVV